MTSLLLLNGSIGTAAVFDSPESQWAHTDAYFGLYLDPSAPLAAFLIEAGLDLPLSGSSSLSESLIKQEFSMVSSDWASLSLLFSRPLDPSTGAQFQAAIENLPAFDVFVTQRVGDSSVLITSLSRSSATILAGNDSLALFWDFSQLYDRPLFWAPIDSTPDPAQPDFLVHPISVRINTIPEPSTALLLSGGLLASACVRARRL